MRWRWSVALGMAVYDEHLRRINVHPSLRRERPRPVTRQTIGTLNSINSKHLNPIKIPVNFVSVVRPLLTCPNQGYSDKLQLRRRVAPSCKGRQCGVMYIRSINMQEDARASPTPTRSHSEAPGIFQALLTTTCDSTFPISPT